MEVNGIIINPQHGEAGVHNIGISVASVNEGIDKEVLLNGVCGNKTASLRIIHEGLREIFRYSDGDFIPADGGTFNVLKVGDPIIPDVPDQPTETYTRLAYVECNGQQYFDLGYVVKENDAVECRYILTQISNSDKFLFGTNDGSYVIGSISITIQPMFVVVTSQHRASLTHLRTIMSSCTRIR